MLISTSVGKGFAASEEDVRNIRKTYNKIGYEAGDENFGYTDTILEKAIRRFQKDNDLKEDGIMHPKGETERALILNVKEKPKESGSAVGDFVKNRQDMVKEGRIGADKYFHCKANYEATKRGKDGEIAAHILRNARELLWLPKEAYKTGLKRAIDDSRQDQEANRHGRDASKTDKYGSVQEACSKYRPRGLDERY
jgi:peptidoglycan hydrolase-like protein with peptidoglycan-binding domain